MKKNLLEPLKKIIVSLGGAETTSEIKENNLVAVTEKIADTIGSDSNAIGKEIFLITLSGSKNSGLVCDKTFDEIIEAINNKKLLLGYVPRGTIDDDAEAYSGQYGITYDNDNPFVIGFTSTFLMRGEILFSNFYLQADGAMGYMIYTLNGEIIDSYYQSAQTEQGEIVQ